MKGLTCSKIGLHKKPKGLTTQKEHLSEWGKRSKEQAV